MTTSTSCPRPPDAKPHRVDLRLLTFEIDLSECTMAGDLKSLSSQCASLGEMVRVAAITAFPGAKVGLGIDQKDDEVEWLKQMFFREIFSQLDVIRSGLKSPRETSEVHSTAQHQSVEQLAASPDTPALPHHLATLHSKELSRVEKSY
jgi:hypothetical protein